MGAPSNEVMALIGKTCSDPNPEDITLHKQQTTAPISALAGVSIL
jgi:hypothetical protein